MIKSADKGSAIVVWEKRQRNKLTYMLSLQTVVSIYNLAHATLSIVKRVYHIVRL